MKPLNPSNMNLKATPAGVSDMKYKKTVILCKLLKFKEKRLVSLGHDAEIYVLVQNDTIEKNSKLDPIIYQKIEKAHNALIGHGDVQKTMNILTKKLRTTWKRMRNDVSTFIERCPCC